MTETRPNFDTPHDVAGAFCPHGRFVVPGAPSGPLLGLSFGAKDLFDVAGHVTGAGNPRWLETHAPAPRTAPSVQALLDAGATLIGKTITDELAYSLNGDNIHYGTPVNVNAPGRVPGGSSSGSAAAVATRLCDFALATDSGGSVRVPASFCGIYGLRTTHGRLSMMGVVPLMPSFDTVGWFATDAARLAQIGAVLLDRVVEAPANSKRLILIEEAVAEATPRVMAALKSAISKLADFFLSTSSMALVPEGLEAWRAAFRAFSAAETWCAHGAWIKANRPDFAPVIADRFAYAEMVSSDEAERASIELRKIRAHLTETVRDDTFLCVPSAPGPAPLIDAKIEEIEGFRRRTQRLTCIASIAGLPQLSIPAGVVDGCPVGLSLIGPPNADLHLLDLAARLSLVL